MSGNETLGAGAFPGKAGARPGGGKAAALLWRINRLRCMSAGEIAHRCARALQAHAEKLGLAGRAAVPAAAVPASGAELPAHWIAPAPGIDPAPYLAAAERVAAGRFDVFALRDAQLGLVPNWNRDPKTGIEAPLAFGKLLDYRDERLVGDIKYLWEPNRHLHLVTLAQAYALSGDPKYAGVLRLHLESWFEACPWPMGANWSSALEPALRLINWSAAWQLLGGARSPLFAGEGARFRDRWLESVYRHAEFVRGHFSLHSSANNHLLGEAAGVFIAAITWPHWPQADRWHAEAKDLIERHALLQNAPDGVNREQAVSYQQFAFDLMLLPALAGRAAGKPLSGAVLARMEAMLEYLASIMDVGGNLPMFGDSDDAFAAQLSQTPGFCRYRSLLATGAVLFRRPEFKAKAGALDDKTRWLLGAGAQGLYESLDASGARLPVRRAFPDGGYYVMGWDFEQPGEVRLVADAGPLGYQSIAAHGHADALSFTLSVGGCQFLVDPGTYAYHTQESWRAYFRGTSAHNTVRIDGVDQSVPGGKFMWLRKARARCDAWVVSTAEDVFEGRHDGYTRLADPVLHRRRITADKAGRRILIRDRLEMKGTHLVEIFFHLSERCSLAPVEGGYRIVQGATSIVLRLPQAAGARAAVHYGSSAPVSGWVSRAFDEKRPAWTIVWRGELCATAELHSEIELPGPREAGRPEPTGRSGEAVRRSGMSPASYKVSD
jgi:hypothetical protein